MIDSLNPPAKCGVGRVATACSAKFCWAKRLFSSSGRDELKAGDAGNAGWGTQPTGSTNEGKRSIALLSGFPHHSTSFQADFPTGQSSNHRRIQLVLYQLNPAMQRIRRIVI